MFFTYLSKSMRSEGKENHRNLWFTLRSRKVKTVSEAIHEVVGKINQAGMQLETAAHARGAKRLQEKDGTQPETTLRIRRVLPKCNLSFKLQLDCFFFF